MTYAALEELIKRLALDTLAGVGHFHVGGSESLAEAVEEHGYPVIHLDPITGSRDIEAGSKTASVALGFFEQGAPDLTAQDLQALYERQELVSASFLAMLQEEDELGDIVVRDTLVKGYTAQQLAGIACDFQLKLPISLCF